MTATFGPPGVSSDAMKVRPIDARTPSEIEERRGHARARQLLRLLAAGRIELVVGDRRNPVERAPSLIARRELDKRRVGKRGAVDAALRVDAGQHEQPRRLGKRQRPQQRGVDDAEDRGVRADADRDHRNRDAGELPGLQQRAQRVSHAVSHNAAVTPRSARRPRRRAQSARARRATHRTPDRGRQSGRQGYGRPRASAGSRGR